MALAPGARLGPYAITAPLGAGGMGEVYRARDTRLDRNVALKILKDSVAADTDRLRVTTWTFTAAGDATGRHRHEYDYVVVPVTGGRFQVTAADGSVREMDQVAGSPYLGTAGTDHDVVSEADDEAVFVEIELKG